MRKLLLVPALAFVLAASAAGAIVLPADGFFPGWARSESPRAFPGSRLFDHIDGGAELYLEFGFVTLAVQRYAKGEDELVLEIYEMSGPEAALGLYLMKCGRETPLAEVPARNSSEAAQFTILRGRYFIHVNNPSAREDVVPAMAALAARALDSLPDERPADILSKLPADGLVPGSAILFRGPIGLQSVVTLGDGDILDQRGSIFGASATYENPGTGRHAFIRIAYPDTARAASAFAGLVSRLDPYLKVIEKGPARFVFEDFKKEFGLAELLGDRIEIRVGLKKPPVR